MKTLPHYILLLLCCSLSLYGMGDDASSCFPFDELPPEIKEKILDYAHEPMPLVDGIQAVREYKHDDDVGLVLWSPNSMYIANDCMKQVIIEPCLGGNSVSLPGWQLAMPMRGETVWSPDSSLIVLSTGPFVDVDNKHKIAVYTSAGEKRYEIAGAGGDRRVHWLSDGRLLTYKDDDIQIHSPRGELDFKSHFDEKILLNLWSSGSSFVDHPEDDRVCMYRTEGRVCAEWKKDREPSLTDMLQFIRVFYSDDPDKIHKIYTASQDGRHIECTTCKGVDMVQWSPDGTRLARHLAENGCSKIQLCTDNKDIPYAEWEGDGFCWSPCGRLVCSSSSGDDSSSEEGSLLTFHTYTGDEYSEWRFDAKIEDIWDTWRTSLDGSFMLWVKKCSLVDLRDRRVQIWSNIGNKCAEYEHSGVAHRAEFSPDVEHIAVVGYDGVVKIGDLRRLLLAHHKLFRPTIRQYLLLKKLQGSILKEHEPAILGQAERERLDEMPDIKKLMRIETNTAKTKLRLMLKRDVVTSPVGQEEEVEI